MNRLFTVEQVEAHNKRVRQGKPKADAVSVDGLNSRANGRGPKASTMRESSADAASKPAYETWLENQLLAVGVTGMEREYLWARGRKYRADLAFPEYRLIVEINGAAHRIKGRFKDDILKHQEAILQGWVMLPVSTAQVRDGDACKLVKWVLAMLMAKSVPF